MVLVVALIGGGMGLIERGTVVAVHRTRQVCDIPTFTDAAKCFRLSTCRPYARFICSKKPAND